MPVVASAVVTLPISTRSTVPLVPVPLPISTGSVCARGVSTRVSILFRLWRRLQVAIARFGRTGATRMALPPVVATSWLATVTWFVGSGATIPGGGVALPAVGSAILLPVVPLSRVLPRCILLGGSLLLLDSLLLARRWLIRSWRCIGALDNILTIRRLLWRRVDTRFVRFVGLALFHIL